MKTIVKIALALVVLTATVQAGRAAIKHYAFVDAVQEAMLFAGSQTEDQLADHVLALASEHEIPLQPGDVAVRREAYLVAVTGTYRETVELIPGVYSRPWDFSIDTSTRLLEDTRPRGPSTPRRR
ncbi:MAG: hypothetical protein IT178_10520 [Acidobacteria bacterium]|nr:hypothetical protein [Acidobacteriota bacterium]